MKKISFILLALALSFSAFSCSNSDQGHLDGIEKPSEPSEPNEPTEPNEPSEPSEPNDSTYIIPADLKEYYQSVDFSKTGEELFTELHLLTKDMHTRELNYMWDHIKNTDLTPEGNEVYLLYGHKGVTTGQKAYTRGKNKNSGNKGDWNREHVYAKSLATPKLIASNKSPDAGTDAHNLRASDVQWNAARGNLLFIDGEGFSGKVENGWYPGDEWKGDVARMMMYMYVRYQDQCLPTGVAWGEVNELDPNMVNILLEWNAEDPVSQVEVQRNNYLGNLENEFAQGNRNPFIDNPNLATQIWGGPKAENLWN